jgi:hypothetical protein
MKLSSSAGREDAILPLTVMQASLLKRFVRASFI